jgi:hypothetical protein
MIVHRHRERREKKQDANGAKNGAEEEDEETTDECEHRKRGDEYQEQALISITS